MHISRICSNGLSLEFKYVRKPESLLKVLPKRSHNLLKEREVANCLRKSRPFSLPLSSTIAITWKQIIWSHHWAMEGHSNSFESLVQWKGKRGGPWTYYDMPIRSLVTSTKILISNLSHNSSIIANTEIWADQVSLSKNFDAWEKSKGNNLLTWLGITPHAWLKTRVIHFNQPRHGSDMI